MKFDKAIEDQDLVAVQWVDSCSADGWHDRDSAGCYTDGCVTVGVLVAETKHTISVAGTIDRNMDSVCCVMSIPKISIIEVRPLTVGTEERKIKCHRRKRKTSRK